MRRNTMHLGLLGLLAAMAYDKGHVAHGDTLMQTYDRRTTRQSFSRHRQVWGSKLNASRPRFSGFKERARRVEQKQKGVIA